MNRALTRCPVCEDSLLVSELSCPSCQTRIQGEFQRCRYCGVPAEHSQFVEAFLRNRGNLTNVGLEMGLSYPTVSRRLDAALASLGLRDGGAPRAVVAPRPAVRDGARKRILEALDAGEITAEEATRRLQEMVGAVPMERSK